MAGRRSPWGGGAKGDGPVEDETPGAPASGDEPSSDGEPSSGTGEDASGQPGSSAPPPPRGPRNPWLPPSDTPPRRTPSIEEIFRSREQRKKGRPGGGPPTLPKLPRRPDGKSWAPLIVGALVLVWLGVSTTHMIGTKEQGIVTTFGKYSHTVDPGVALTLPWPIQTLTTTDVTSIKRDTIPEGETEKLMLTSDQNLVDLSYLVRWNIKNLKLYSFQLADPDETVREVAEAAMRASIAEVPLTAAMGGAGRAEVEQNVRTRMQGVLDAYRSGVQIQGVEIKKADPPSKTIAAFQQVTAAQQDAQRDISNAQAWAQQLTAQAQGSATAFEKVYEQYKLAPDVTRRRMYYETMERVLSNNDKVIVDANGINSYLPLPQIVKKPPAPQASDSAGDGK
jgi:membrane protease subunit HflK